MQILTAGAACALLSLPFLPAVQQDGGTTAATKAKLQALHELEEKLGALEHKRAELDSLRDDLEAMRAKLDPARAVIRVARPTAVSRYAVPGTAVPGTAVPGTAVPGTVSSVRPLAQGRYRIATLAPDGQQGKSLFYRDAGGGEAYEVAYEANGGPDGQVKVWVDGKEIDVDAAPESNLFYVKDQDSDVDAILELHGERVHADHGDGDGKHKDVVRWLARERDEKNDQAHGLFVHGDDEEHGLFVLDDEHEEDVHVVVVVDGKVVHSGRDSQIHEELHDTLMEKLHGKLGEKLHDKGEALHEKIVKKLKVKAKDDHEALDLFFMDGDDHHVDLTEDLDVIVKRLHADDHDDHHHGINLHEAGHEVIVELLAGARDHENREVEVKVLAEVLDDHDVDATVEIHEPHPEPRRVLRFEPGVERSVEVHSHDSGESEALLREILEELRAIRQDMASLRREVSMAR